MRTRPAALEDLPAITELQQIWDATWLGAAEHSEDEVREELVRVHPLAEQGLLVHDGATLVGAGWWCGSNATLMVNPAAPVGAVRDVLLEWFTERRAPQIEALGADAELRGALESRGWAHALGLRAHPSGVIGLGARAPGLGHRGRGPAVAAAGHRGAHRLIYHDARWADVLGHVDRDLQEWRSLFAAETAGVDQQVVVWRGDRLVGAAIGRIFSDGTGWVSQLAVSGPERRRGLGRALLLEAFARRRAAGARALGLGVQATNAAALELYLGVGLRIDREWRTHEFPSA